MKNNSIRDRGGAKHPDTVFHEDQREFFDRLITQEWETYLNPVWDLSREFEVDRLFEGISPKRVLDVGCGCGYHDLLMSDKPGVAEVLGIDYSEKSIETANRVYAHPKVKRIVADIRDDAWTHGDFDLAASFQVIEHLVDARGFLESCARRVRPGGWVALATPNRKRLLNRLVGIFGVKPLLEDYQHCAEYTPAEMRQIGESVGLQFEGWFGYDLSLTIPKLGWNPIPRKRGIALGYRLPKIANRFCMTFRKPKEIGDPADNPMPYLT